MTTVKAGDVKELVLTEEVTRTQLVQYSGASGDYNPLHSDERYATEVAGFPSVFAHGMLTMGMTGRVITDWFGPEAVLSYGARFVAQVWPGDRLVATATVGTVRDDGVAELTISTTNQSGDVVLSATATVRTG
ncbi:MAG TPA: MaoC/PaaZ C-terminal domain-containing protein [Acidimicrobiales bacterium]|nr:MaoC/PaaZ C-terminal domain-containing protein [Acidimicrobiales bacterium]